MEKRGWLLPRWVAVTLLATACTSTNAPSNPSAVSGLPLVVSTLHFTLHYNSATSSRIASYATALPASSRDTPSRSS